MILKDKDMPSLYWSNIPLLNTTTMNAEDTLLPFVLPHEVFAKMVANAPASRFRAEMTEALSAELQKSCTSLGLPATSMIPLGLHGDGVPHQKHGSIECFFLELCWLAPHGPNLVCSA